MSGERPLILATRFINFLSESCEVNAGILELTLILCESKNPLVEDGQIADLPKPGDGNWFEGVIPKGRESSPQIAHGSPCFDDPIFLQDNIETQPRSDLLDRAQAGKLFGQHFCCQNHP